MNILNNPWFTGIGGGIISSLIVFFVTRFFFNKREKSEYLQKIRTANNEILYSIRPLIIEKKMPTKEIMNSIRISIAKKYGVKKEDLYDEFSLSNDLINEIMGNSFLSSDQKIEFCSLLESLKKIGLEKEEKKVEYIYIKDRYSLFSNYSSILLASIAFIMVLVSTFVITKTSEINTDSIAKEKLPIFLTATLIPIIALGAVYIFRIVVRDSDLFDFFSRKKKKKNVG